MAKDTKINDYENYANGANFEHPFNDEFFEHYNADFENDFDDFVEEDEELHPFSEIDFSDFKGSDFKSNLKRVDRKVFLNRKLKEKKFKSGNRLLKKIKKIEKGNHRLVKDKFGKTHKIIVPSDREVIVQGVSKFILSNHPSDEDSKRIAYYKGKKLNNMTLIFNNEGQNDFDLQLFDPSMPLDYLYSQGLNLNDKITVSSGTTKYSDLLFNLLANPTMIVSAQLVVSGPTQQNITDQFNESFQFKNKNIAGLQAIEPLSVNLYRDVMQAQNFILNFNIMKQLGRPFIPDGMDVIIYRIKAGNTVTMNFFYKQVQIKRMVFEEARRAKNLL